MPDSTENSPRDRALVATLREIADSLAGIRSALERMNEARPHFGLPKREDTHADGALKSRYDEGD